MIPSSYLFEEFDKATVEPSHLDTLLSQGWRHAGSQFYRYNYTVHEGVITEVIPLRIDLSTFRPSKSQRRLLKKNAPFEVIIRPTVIDEEKHRLFQHHKSKFVDNIPEDIFVFLSKNPAISPSPGCEVAVYDNKRLIAASFFDVGKNALSSIYGMYDLDYANRGLGIFTMLCEIEFGQGQGKSHYYHGYCNKMESFYDYKKRFQSLEAYSWSEKNWSTWEIFCRKNP